MIVYENEIGDLDGTFLVRFGATPVAFSSVRKNKLIDRMHVAEPADE